MARVPADEPKALLLEPAPRTSTIRESTARKAGTPSVTETNEAHGKFKFGAKSEFVRSLDRAIPAADVVELAQRQGMKLTTGLVYNIRSMANGRGSARGHRMGRTRKSIASAESPEAMLRAAIAEVGLAKARAILDEVEDAFAGR